MVPDCNLCEGKYDHICEFDEDRYNQLTDDMKKFGIIRKIIQPSPKKNDEENRYPFWSTKHVYDSSIETWESIQRQYLSLSNPA